MRGPRGWSGFFGRSQGVRVVVEPDEPFLTSEALDQSKSPQPSSTPTPVSRWLAGGPAGASIPAPRMSGFAVLDFTPDAFTVRYVDHPGELSKPPELVTRG